MASHHCVYTHCTASPDSPGHLSAGLALAPHRPKGEIHYHPCVQGIAARQEPARLVQCDVVALHKISRFCSNFAFSKSRGRVDVWREGGGKVLSEKGGIRFGVETIEYSFLAL